MAGETSPRAATEARRGTSLQRRSPVVILVDPSRARREAFARTLGAMGFGAQPVSPERAPSAESLATLAPALVLSACDADSLGFARELRRADPLVPVVAVGPTPPGLARIMELGAAHVHDFLLVARPEEIDRHEERLRALAERTRSRRAGSRVAPEIVGRSAAIDQVRRYVARAARSEANVLITGESGTGKELVARAIHFHGRRRQGPFVAVNCSAIPETLLESELFGHERGAFTGAVSQARGQFEQADGGTLLFDEIGDMPTTLQAKLLRVLQAPPGEAPTCREFTRLGRDAPVRVDVRCLFSTNQDLDALVASGRFREDLLQRLDVLRVRVPPLRERREDVVELAEVFLERTCRLEGRPLLGLDPLARAVLQQHDHPRNVRELESMMQALVALKETDGPVVLGDLPEELFRPAPAPEGTAGGPVGEDGAFPRLAEVVAAHVERAMRQAGGVKAEAARLLGLSRPALDRHLRKAAERG